MHAQRLWHTVRWLRPVQVYGRLRFRIYRPRPVLSPPPAPRAAEGRWSGCRRAPSMTGPQRFRFLDAERELAGPTDWNRADWPELWLYNLHYFDDLAADDAASRAAWHRDLIRRWMADNAPGHGRGWDPYPTSLRIVNWVKWALAGNGLSPEAIHSLAVQVRWLSRRLEIHLLGNHLWANAKALIFAGTFLQGPEADAWRQRGIRLLRRELDEQILSDGGHFERSPMYHAIVVEDLLDLVQLSCRYPDTFEAADLEAWRRAAGRMLRWLAVMSHPDGDIAFFNDAALGVAPSLLALRRYASSLGVGATIDGLAAVEALPASGYVRLQAGPAVLIADAGEIGPDYQPGHAHADTLSFELSLHGRRVFVNGGTSTYAAGAERLRQRGTAAHNTVVVDGEDSSEVWSSFRVARRARPLEVRCGSDRDSLWLEAAHDGYRRLVGDVVHYRRWSLRPDRLVVSDRLTGRFRTATANWLLAPPVSAGCQDQTVILCLAEGLCRLSVEGASPSLQPASWHPALGQARPTQRIQFDFRGSSLTTTMSW
jgi:uncharacterized heparinase superfamily protein